jgi:hypothetical protein
VPRRYDKGERRYKHVGRSNVPEFETHPGNPRRWIGKCPANLSQDLLEVLLGEAIPGPATDRELKVPKRLYVVHHGAIYEAQTSDHGYSYHGYPYRGRLPASLIRSLRTMAQAKACEEPFQAWLKRYIEYGPG